MTTWRTGRFSWPEDRLSLRRAPAQDHESAQNVMDAGRDVQLPLERDFVFDEVPFDVLRPRPAPDHRRVAPLLTLLGFQARGLRAQLFVQRHRVIVVYFEQPRDKAGRVQVQLQETARGREVVGQHDLSGVHHPPLHAIGELLGRRLGGQREQGHENRKQAPHGTLSVANRHATLQAWCFEFSWPCF